MFESAPFQETEKTPETVQEKFDSIVHDFLLDKVNWPPEGENSVAESQTAYQKQLELFYDSSGIQEGIDRAIEAGITDPNNPDFPLYVLHIVQFLNGDKDASLVVNMFPKDDFRQDYDDDGWDCTTGNALLHIALKKNGVKGVHSVLRPGHHLVCIDREARGLLLLDATTRITTDGQTKGYSRQINPGEISNKQLVDEGDNKMGFRFTLNLPEEDRPGGIRNQGTDGWSQNFYAYSEGIYLDQALTIGNVLEIPSEAQKAKEQTGLDRDAYQTALVEWILANNETILSKEDIPEIIRNNYQTLNEMLTNAEESDEENVPNPYDFLFDTKLMLSSSADLASIPKPADFIGASSWAKQCLSLYKKYPHLQTLGDTSALTTELGIFDAHNHL